MARRPSTLSVERNVEGASTSGARKVPSPRALRPLLVRMRPYRVQIALASVALLVSAGITLAFPLVVRYLLDAAFVRASAPALDRKSVV